jgi:polysaccharide chain length determinant protein (PEP-CTERM system associated)
MIVTPLVICTMAGLIVSSSLPDVFESDMLIQVVPHHLDQQVKSRTQLEQMINELGLYPLERQRLPMEDVVELMRANIVTELVRPNRGEPAEAFHVRFTYNDAGIATRVTQRLGTLYIDRNARERTKVAENTDKFLDAKLADARAQLEAQERRLEHFRERYAGRLPSQAEFNMQAIQSASAQAQTLASSIAIDKSRKLMLERLYNEASSPAVEAVPPAPAQGPAAEVAAPANGIPAQQLEAARQALARARMKLKPEHPDVVRLTKTVAQLEKAVKESSPPTDTAPAMPVALSPAEIARRERLQNMRAEIESLDRQIAFKESEERKHRGEVEEYQRRVAAVPGLESEWIALTRDYDTLNNTYRGLLSKSQDARVAADMEKDQIGEQFRILDPARVPVRPVGPNRIQLNAIALGAGLALGLGLVALLEIRDSSVRNERDVLDVLALPVLALVPLILNEREIAAQRRKRALLYGFTISVFAVSGYVFWAMKLWKHVI